MPAMKKLRRELKKLTRLLARQVEQQDLMLGEMRRHNELMARSLELNTAALHASTAVVPAPAGHAIADHVVEPKPRSRPARPRKLPAKARSGA